MDLLKPKVVFTTSFEREFARDIKEQCCQIIANSHINKISVNNNKIIFDKKKYCLPDGKTI